MLQRLPRSFPHALVVLSLFLQAWSFPPPLPAEQAAAPCEGILYDFDGSLQGWAAADYSDGFSTLTLNGEDEVPAGKGSVSLDVVLNRSRPSAEFLVDLFAEPPACAQGTRPGDMLWEPGSVLSAWVWAPEGTLGDPGYTNGVHLFAVDARGRKLYGSWQGIRENTWFEVTLRLDGEQTPACGSRDFGFDPTQIRAIGLNVGVNPDKDHHRPIDATLRMAGISIKKGELGAVPSSHLYSFDDPSQQKHFPRWQRRNQVWTAEAFNDLYVEQGALVTQADFRLEGGEIGRKGVISLISSPPLDLSLQEGAEIDVRLDVSFESSTEQTVHCPFGLTLWLYDEGKKTWYTTAYENIGSTAWTRVAFPLSAFRSAETQEPIDRARIGELALQVWSNTNYQGKVRFDNIALGGVTPAIKLPGEADPLQTEFVTTEGPHFRLGGQRFRFFGANAEYLPFASNAVMDDVLERASALGITVIRTWGFGDGCEDKFLSGCAERSRYFQPEAGAYNQSAFERFDRIVLEAKKRGIRLIVPLANNWPEYGGIPQYVCWQEAHNPTNDPTCSSRLMEDADHDTFYTDPAIRSLYRDYVEHVVSHVNPLTGLAYHEDPTIMAWELINEPRAPSDPSGETLHAWIMEMSAHLAGLAPKQLIGTGQEGWYIMSKEAADKEAIWWQKFNDNYWHYGVNWKPATCTESWGSNGVDFLSDHSSTPQTVTWQESVGPDGETPPLSSVRASVPGVDYTTIHLYPAPGETSLASAPYCMYYGLDSLCPDPDQENRFVGPYHQAREWVAQHVETSHNVLNKPFILEEFNFPVPLTDPKEEGEFRVTPEERARLFTQYLDFAHDLDVDGVMFWNLGYEGFANQPWREAPSLRAWEVQPGSDSIVIDPKDPAGIRLEYDPAQGARDATMRLPNPKVDWLRANGNRIFVNLRNEGDAKSVAFQVRLSNGDERSIEDYALAPGDNQISLDKLFESLPKAESKENCEVPEVEPPHVTGMTVTLRGYTAKGSAAFDFQSVFNNKYVIYPGDPVEEVIRLAATRWGEDPTTARPVLTINQSVSCGAHIHPSLVGEGVPIEFTITNGLEHPDGYFVRYKVERESISRQAGVDEFHIIPAGSSSPFQVLIKPEYEGFNYIGVAAEGERFDALGYSVEGSDSCTLWVENTPPVLRIDQLQAEGQQDPSATTVSFPVRQGGSTRELSVLVSGADDLSSPLQIGCQLMRGGQEVTEGVACLPSLEPAGEAAFIQLQLSPGNYELHLWAEDEDGARSEVQILKIQVPYPWYVYVLLALVGIALLIVGVSAYVRRQRHSREVHPTR